MKASAALKELLVLAAIAVLVGVLAITFEAFEAFTEWSRQHEEWQVDEVVSVISILSVAAMAFSWRRWREARREVIKRERAEEKLRQQSEDLSEQAEMIDLAHDAIVVRDPADTIVRWNQGAIRTYGWAREEVVGKITHTLLQTSFPTSREAVDASLLHEGRWEGEVEHAQRDGTRIKVESRQVMTRDEHNAPKAILEINRDVTERKQAERELERARESAEAANRAKSEFLANMSHEIRTPMNGVIGMTGLLLDTDLDPEQREYAETVRVSGENLLTILNDILDFSKIEAGKLHLEIIDFDLRSMVEEVVGLLGERAQHKDLELASLVEHGVPTALRGDPGRLSQVLTNLLGNAVKFTEKGEIVLRAKRAEDTPGAAMIRFEVTDTGIGMTDEQQGRLFNSFTQADASTTRKYGGTGLGLAISKQLVELMGGEIGLESAPGAGSTFWFAVPLEKQPEGARETAPSPRADLHGLRVLVVDDNATNREIVHHQVTSWGMGNGSAENGHKALEMLRAAAERGEPYDVAILDMQMPGMDGLMLAGAIKDSPAIASTRLILLTSMGQRGDGEQARRAGIEAYLTKPVRQSQLYDALATVMGTHEALASSPSAETRLITRHTSDEARARSSFRILLAEDNSVNQKVAVRMLEKLGYHADVAANGLEALDALSRIPYAAVLMDVQMPEMDGYEATAEIRNRERDGGRHTPIIAMTANAMQGDREKALEAGMDDYVPKPVKREELGAVLDRWIAEDYALEEKAETIPASLDGSSPASEEAPLDHEVLQSLRELGDEGFMAELVSLFVGEVPSLLVSLRDALGREDTGAVERVAHALHGSCGNIGAVRMAALCEKLQHAGASGDLARAPGLVGEVEAEFGRVCPALEAEVAKV